MYIIKDIAHKNGQTRLDGRYPSRIGSTIRFPYPIKIGSPMLLEYVMDSAGKEKSGYLRTSNIVEISAVKDDIVVETENSIYKFEKVKDTP